MINPESRTDDPFLRNEESLKLRSEAVALVAELTGTLLLHEDDRGPILKALHELEAKLKDELKTSTAP